MNAQESWRKTLVEQAQRLESVAQWAYIVNCTSVGDYARMARHELILEIEEIDAQLESKPE